MAYLGAGIPLARLSHAMQMHVARGANRWRSDRPMGRVGHLLALVLAASCGDGKHCTGPELDCHLASSACSARPGCVTVADHCVGRGGDGCGINLSEAPCAEQRLMGGCRWIAGQCRYKCETATSADACPAIGDCP